MSPPFSFRFSSSLSIALGLLVGLALPTPGSATILATNSFEGNTLGALSGQGGGSGWTGTWGAPTAGNTVNVVDTTSNPLSFTPTGGAQISGATRALEVSGTANGPCGARQLTTPIAQTFYAGYLVRYQAGAGLGGNNTFTLYLATGASDTTGVNFGLKLSGGNSFHLRTGTTGGVFVGGALAVGTTYYLVVRMNWSGSAYTNANMWVNPALNDNTAKPNGDATFAASSAAISHIFLRQAALDADDVLRADEIKIGTAWSDVVPPASPPPTITLQPRSQTNCVGTTATFTAVATAPITPTVQWQVSTNAGGSWANIAGATSTNYSPATVMANNGNLYRAVFSNVGGSTNSSAARLTVNSGPTAVNFSTTAPPNQPRVIDIAALLAACTALEGNAFYLSAVAPLSTNGAPVAITATNTVVYRPRTGFTGVDRFNYTITDLFGCSATAAVQMTVGP